MSTVGSVSIYQNYSFKGHQKSALRGGSGLAIVYSERYFFRFSSRQKAPPETEPIFFLPVKRFA
jgi:hypothetical protein